MWMSPDCAWSGEVYVPPSPPVFGGRGPGLRRAEAVRKCAAFERFEAQGVPAAEGASAAQAG